MLTNVVSPVRQGKTLFNTSIALREAALMRTPRPLLANYRINLPNWKPFRPEMLFKINSPTLVLLDEAYKYLESRQSGGATINRYMSYILFQSGKRGIDFYMTDQIEGTIDTRYRQLLDYRVECENLGEGKGFVYYTERKVRGGFTRPSVRFLPWAAAEKIFPWYDTYEIVNPIDEDMLEKISEDKTDSIALTQKIVDEMLKELPPNAWKKNMVDNFCIEHFYPHYQVNRCFAEIRIRIARNIYKDTYTKRVKRGEGH